MNSLSVARGDTRIQYLDGWRGCAILAVLIGHFGTSELLNMGRFGVELFFVLSGRLMAEILFGRKAQLDTFFFRRFSRVWPVLFFFMTVMLGLEALQIGDVDWRVWLASLTFTSNYAMGFGIGATWASHIWSLCVEEHAYLLLGLIAFVSRRFFVPVVPVLIVLAVAAIANGAFQTWVLKANYYEVYWRSDVRGASIFMSAAVYMLARSGRGLGILNQPWSSIVFGFAGLLLQINAVPDPIKYSIGTLSLALSLSALPQAFLTVTGMLSSRLLLGLGAISYSLYVWQQPFFATLDGALSVLPKLAQRGSHLAAALLVAFISYKIVETPARRALNMFWGYMERPRCRPGVSDDPL